MKNNIKVGDTITSKVHYTGDERAHGAYLSEVKNLGVSTKNVAIEKPVIPSNYLLYAFPFIASCCVLAIMIVTHKRA